MSPIGTIRVKIGTARRLPRRRKGAVLVLAAFLMVGMMAFLAYSIDGGYILTMKSELKRATDAAALAGAGSLIDGVDAAELQAFAFFSQNAVGSNALSQQPGWEDDLSGKLAEFRDSGRFKLLVGSWDPEGQADPRDMSDPTDPVDGRFHIFDPATDSQPSAIRVRATVPDVPTFFSSFFRRHRQTANGTEAVPIELAATSIARYQPRDIALVLDFSASMNDDSELKRIYEYGQSVRDIVEANLLQIYAELGSPTYGNMTFEPQYVSYSDTDWVKWALGLLRYENGRWVEEPYPYPSGSWDNYISYVKSSSYIYHAGYRRKYGYLTLINYWLEQKPTHAQTPDLWKVSAQPVTAVKNAVDVFMDYIREVDTDDKVGLVVYNSPSQNALVEHHLTDDFDVIEATVQQRQAGHYDNYTNIGAGIREGRIELDDNARVGAFKMIVLMTDGNANRPSSTSYARSYALQQAELAAEQRYPIVTISLGNAADTDLMQQIADLTGGVHFNIPGNGSVTDYRAALMEVFRQIADDRPLVLVK